MADTTILEKMHNALGPWGISLVGYDDWNYIPDGFIKKIRISHATGINSIEFQSDCSKGASQKSFFGGQGGVRTDEICINYPDEYLTSISGTVSFHVTSLCFHTNHNRYGPYGDSKTGTPFSYRCEGGVIVGFYGCLGHHDCIGTIGVYVMPKSPVLDRNFTLKDSSRFEKCCMISENGSPWDAGPWGASGGKPWDDGVFNSIKQVRVQVGEPSGVIFGIPFKYVIKDGKFILSRFHGGIDHEEDISEVEINLDGVQEYLIGVSGVYGPVEGYDGLEGITSLTFHTNKGKHGPYGQESGAGCVCFKSKTSSGKVVGFHGRNGDFLTAIGVHMEYF